VIRYSSTHEKEISNRDLSDAEWECIEPHLPTPRAPGRPRVHTLREITDAIFYMVRSGCAWRLLPHEFAPWKTIHHYFRTLGA
jgi:putative transposase